MIRRVGDALLMSYHAVSEQWPASLAVRPADLESQMRYLARREYQGLTVQDSMRAPSGGRRLAVTFDDGYRSVLDLAFPILAAHGFVGTVFVVTDFVGHEGPMTWPGIDDWVGGPWDRELWSLTWGQLRTLADAGWEVGAHTGSHPHLTRLGDIELRAQLEDSRARCEEYLQRDCRSLAYPYGDHDDRVVEAARVAGYTAAVTLPERFPSSEALRCPRVGVYRDDGPRRFRAKVSPTVRRLRRARAWTVAARLARLASARAAGGPSGLNGARR